MVFAMIEHFLSREGLSYLPDWIDLTRKELHLFDGFLGIDQIKDLKNQDRNLILLQFDIQENLELWSKSDRHKKCIELLTPFVTQKRESQIFITI